MHCMKNLSKNFQAQEATQGAMIMAPTVYRLLAIDLLVEMAVDQVLQSKEVAKMSSTVEKYLKERTW